jgi:hypothetical protein
MRKSLWSELRVAAAAIAMCAVLAGGCRHGDECVPEESHCEGNALMYCSHPSETINYARWIQADCSLQSQMCVANGQAALCALSPDKDPACAAASIQYDQVCVGAELITCRSGFRTEVETCQSADLCLTGPQTPRGAMCVLSTTPDPLCDSDPDPNSVCDGSVLVRCRNKYRVKETDCGPGRCQFRPEAPLDSACAMSPTGPDPRCQAAAQVDADGNRVPATWACSDNTVIQCNEDQLVYEKSCGAARCVNDSSTPNGKPDASVMAYCQTP